jgi:hypothetical protein
MDWSYCFMGKLTNSLILHADELHRGPGTGKTLTAGKCKSSILSDCLHG